MKKILVLCTGNSCRSQIAEGYLRYFAGNSAEIYSAGIETHGVNPKAIEIMKRDGIDISQHTSNHINEYLSVDFDYVITVCDETSAGKCPVFPGKAKRIHWGFEDPSNLKGSDTERLNRTRKIRDAIQAKIEEWLGPYRLQNRINGRDFVEGIKMDPGSATS